MTNSPVASQKVLATCHALVNMDDELVGDPLEQAMFRSVDWTLTKGEFGREYTCAKNQIVYYFCTSVFVEISLVKVIIQSGI